MIKIVYNEINDQGPVSNVSTSGDKFFGYVNPFLNKMIDFEVIELKDLNHEKDSFLYELPWNILPFIEEIYNNLDIKIVEGIKHYKGYFVLNDSVDPLIADNLQTLAEFLNSKDINPKKLIYLSGCFDISSANDHGVSLMPSYWHETTMAFQFSNRFLEHDQFVMPKLKKFISLNRTWRHHRLHFLYELYKNKLLTEFDISFLKTDPETEESYPYSLYNKSCGFYPNEELPQIKKLGGEIDTLLPLQVDDISALTEHVSHSHIDTHSRYFFNVVTETVFYNFYNTNNNTTFEGIHLSEKILKPILYKTPFILVGPYGGLKVMRSLGYKTFSEFIDESYDEIEDSYLRMQAIFSLIKDINRMSDARLAEIDILVRDVCEHNFNHLKERGNTANAQLTRTFKKIVYSLS
jgi:hypothetical protein